ncbi:glycoside hydrolase family 99-like domain-containing protein [Xanthomonas prunicola]|uniref:Lipopolysaccharide biosynthesis protein n=1 Tax=Xanthomonas prunicola TaxID=2053930 RepID=A0A2N3RPL8_9XANT|nr:glycoside hydrolase family 99-like domain-containing protein [Xanthomonas prunicola]PKV14380.1 lipopolysaccharide biosynthesis protein [Xanthomonas prunicola]PKV18662.1 lipopolysaccharide biosynthesis protein [Xanthomonas prunicola]PKV22029.1 lipopolysaccharide biosynthesis protein [Xanthomonas prunicola]
MSKVSPGIENNYTYNGEVWVPNSRSQEFGYTDGDEAEERIAASILGCDDVSLFSRPLQEYQTDWPSRYHLSSGRANLLRPISDLLKGRVLEVGSGCGAISRYLGEIGASLTALEGSSRRARITASRCRDLPNVRVVNDVLENFSAQEGFDALTLIGVLEYANVYGQSNAPAQAWLQKAHSLLADDGCLIVAIENQLGLKYFAGMPEDHVGKPMHGISDNYDATTVATYGRLQLMEMLQSAGFESCELLLPFPDYKFPTVVLAPGAYDGSHPEFDAGTLAAQSAIADPQLPYAPLFSLERAWSVIARNGLLPDMANSFLFVARKKAKPADSASSGNTLAHHFATNRLPVFCKQVQFQAKSDGVRIDVVPKRLLDDDSLELARPISMELNASEYVLGHLHTRTLEKIVSRDGWRAAEIAEWLMLWKDTLLRGVADSQDASDVSGLLPGWALDALPRNLMIDQNGAAEFIDLEWIWHGQLELLYLSYRALVGSMTSLVAVGIPEDISHLHVPVLLRTVMQIIGSPVDDADIERFIELDGVVTRLVYGRDSGLIFKNFMCLYLRSIPDIAKMSGDWNAVKADAAERIASVFHSAESERAANQVKEAQFHQERSELCSKLEEKVAEIKELRGQRADQELKLEQLAHLAEQARVNEQRLERDLIQSKDTMEAYAELVALAASRANELNEVYSSTSWRITMPLRVMRNVFRPRFARNKLSRGLRQIYLKVPVSSKSRQLFKTTLFKLFPWLFSNTNAYRSWYVYRHLGEKHLAPAAPHVEDPSNLETARTRYVQSILQLPSSPSNEYVPIAEMADKRPFASRVIAFYLPQFHPIAENDEWWGRGFTEWTNVAKAVPQFIGHYQPHLPGELGFYDLRIVDVMRRQAELAKLYGVEGFCFHYYWFAGKRLLERPLDQLLASDIDLPFCICWANENWTRRWDGLENEVLIAQDYGPEDDLAFIKTLEPLLRDPRYIRVDGRPLVILYRPSLLPDAASTLDRWRAYCRESGVGELFLCMVQFDKLDPREYGFDAAVEFPPHKVAAGLPSINHELEIINPGYQGSVVDYANVVDKALSEAKPEFDLIRGVFPSWDNDARKPGRGYTVARSTPARYRTWLRGAVDYSRKFPVRGESLVFVNAWNEWAEGAHLEPDRRYGYAYLEATRRALRQPATPRTPERVAVVIHVFYPELLPEMLKELQLWDVPYLLIISTVPDKEDEVKRHLADLSVVADVRVFENRGRDILPFLEIMKDLRGRESLVLKLHTKRSLHRQDGESWRRDMLEKLLAPKMACDIFAAFREQERLGLAAPEGHILPMTTYWGANADTVHRLSKQMRVDPVNPVSAMFAAGSMFYVRPEAIDSIMDLDLRKEDFEPEAGQVDGTLAHAIERCFSLAVCSTGYYIASSNLPMVEAYETFEAYAYADPSP